MDKRLTTQLGLRMQTCFSLPGQPDDKIRRVLDKLAAKLREEPPD